jgi:hypothetical protein
MDHVVAGNEYLAAMFRDRGCKVTVLPTCVDPGHYMVKQPGAMRDPVRLVWIGSSSTLPYLNEIVPALRQVDNVGLITIADRTIDDSAGLKC